MLIDTILEPGNVRIEFQPIVHLHEGESLLYAVEALTRGPQGTSAARPDVLFEYARRKGEETSIDLHCLQEAMTAAALLPRNTLISMNVHGSTLTLGDFAENFLSLAERHEIPAQHLMLEIVEHRSKWDLDALKQTLLILRQAGVRIALDDLGVGASNYHMFIDCHPDHIKIDRYIVNGCSRDPHRVEVLRSIIALGAASEATLIAEGIETEDDLETVRSLGIECFQGWLFSPSLSPADMARSKFVQLPSYLCREGTKQS